MARKSPDQIERRRRRAFSSLSREGQDLAQRLDAKIVTEAAGIIVTAYDIGAYLVEALADEDRYGIDCLQQIATYLDFSGGVRALLEHVDFARAFTREFVIAQSRRLMPTGHVLTFAHWLALTRVVTEQDRQALLKKVFSESLSASQLASEIGGLGVARPSRGPGRRPSVPTSPIILLQRFYDKAKGLTSVCKTLEKSVSRPLDELTDLQVSDVLLTQLQSAQKGALDARQKADEVAARLGGNIQRVRDMLSHAGGTDTANADQASARDG
jgi:hypothetical protein